MNNLKLLKISEEANDELAPVLEHNISKATIQNNKSKNKSVNPNINPNTNDINNSSFIKTIIKTITNIQAFKNLFCCCRKKTEVNEIQQKIKQYTIEQNIDLESNLSEDKQNLKSFC